LGVTICLSQVALPIDQLRVWGVDRFKIDRYITHQNCKKLAAISSLSVSFNFAISLPDFCRRSAAEGVAMAAWLKLELRLAESEGLLERAWTAGGLRPFDWERL
jgi:hypothetical protein